MVDRSDPRTWVTWHDDYTDARSSLSRRLAVVIGRLRQALDALPAGPVRLVSACAGQGHDVVGALADHPRADDVTGRLLEADPDNVRAARASLAAAGLSGIEADCVDASMTDAYLGLVPADVLLLCGIFGNVSDDDVRTTAESAAFMCATGGYVIWTRHRRAPDLTPRIRTWFDGSGFDEVSFDSPGPDDFSVGMHRFTGEPARLPRGRRLFTFLR